MKGFRRNSLILLGFLLFGGLAMACPASYVKSLADQNKGTSLYDKSERIADKYMTSRGMDPNSAAGQVTRPYVIGTTLVEHDLNRLISTYAYYEQYNKPEERIDLDKDSVDDAVRKALGIHAGTVGQSDTDMNGHGILPCWSHFNRHFGNGIHEAGGMGPPPTKMDLLGG